MTNLLEQVEENITTRRLFPAGAPVLVAVSGGLDSMVLLQVLHQLSDRYSWRLAVAHFNHQLRGASSDADERLVRRMAKQLGCKIVVDHADVKRFAGAQKLSLEMAARRLRHEFLARAARKFKIRFIALAHHGDDQIELFFLRLLRGSGSEGLSGMKWGNRSPADSEVQLVRPLLNTFKETLADYAAQNGIEFREDATNQSLDIQRNRIRHELLPLLKQKYQPALNRTITRVMDLAEAEASCLAEWAAGWIAGRKRDSFQKLPVAIQRRCIQLQLRQKNLDAGYDLIEGLRKSPANSPITLSPELAVCLDADGRLHLSQTASWKPETACVEVDLRTKQGKVAFGKTEIKWKVAHSTSRKLPTRKANFEIFDADKVGTAIVLRTWQPGDRFQPIGAPNPVKLQDFFTNQKIPRPERHKLTIGVAQDGTLFWVEGLRIAERFKLSAKTNRRLHWQWKTL